jgi:hypothetical protein
MPKLLGLYALPPAVGEPVVGCRRQTGIVLAAASVAHMDDTWRQFPGRGHNLREKSISAQTGLKGYGTTVKYWEASVVPAYRIYELHARRRVVRPALILILIRENDADVIRTVKPPVDGHDVEIMEGARVVARLSNRQIVAAR